MSYLEVKREARIFFVLIVATLILINLSSAQQQSLGTQKQNQCVELIQSCGTCTYVNITSIRYPNSTQALGEVAMTKTGTFYNYTFCSTTALGLYLINGVGNPNGTATSWVYDLYISESGEPLELPQALIMFSLLGLVGLFFGIGMTFSKEKWKLRSLFFMMALFMGLIMLNLIRISIGTSAGFSIMASIALISGLVIVIFMFLWLFINWTVETFGYFKKKNRNKWSVNEVK